MAKILSDGHSNETVSRGNRKSVVNDNNKNMKKDHSHGCGNGKKNT